MKLTSPATSRHSFRVGCYKGGKSVYTFASSASGRHEFEVEDHIEAVKYTAGDISWVWDGENWLQGKAAETALKPKKTKSRDPKPARVKEWTSKDRIDPALYTAAEEYADAFDERQKAVKKSFRKVTKPL